MRILSFGSLNTDYVYQVPHILRGGETLSSTARNVYCGGKGLNQSIAMARAGADVYHAGAVGEGDGEALIAALAESGVHTDGIARLHGTSSGHTVIQVASDGQNCILLFGGANRLITETMAEGMLAPFAAGDILVLQNEISALSEIMRIAAQKGMRIVLNPSPADENLALLPLMLVDTFVLNEVEAEVLTDQTYAKQQMEALSERFPHAEILLTLGKDGCLYQNGQCGERYSQKAYVVAAVDTTAAGDTFLGYFVARRAAGASVETALQLATAAATLCVLHEGAAPSIPMMEQVDSFCRNARTQEGMEEKEGDSVL